MILTLEEVKSHCRIDADYHNDDDDLYSLIAVAEDNIAQRLRYGSMEEAFPSGRVPETVRHAVLMFTVHYYENAGVVSAVDLKPVNQGALALIGRYIKYHNT